MSLSFLDFKGRERSRFAEQNIADLIRGSGIVIA
jgi:hypothetical protein